MNSHVCTCVSHPEPPSHLLPHPIPQDCPSAPALSPCFMHGTQTGVITEQFLLVLEVNSQWNLF